MAGVRLGKAYASVEDLLLGEHPDHPECVDAFIKEAKRQQIAQALFMLRTYHGVTQAEMAKRMGVTQSAVAKLEDRGDQVRMNDVIRYAAALDYETKLLFAGNSVTLAGQMRWHLEAVTAIMAKLEVIAADDPDISASALRHFSNETSNMLANVLPGWIDKIAKIESGDSSAPDRSRTAQRAKGGLALHVVGKSKEAVVG
jgi:transcriptional regulator with XRE-family HTH domain